MERRAFLQRGLAGGALLALGGVGLGRWRGTARHAPVRPLHVLDAFAFGVVAAAAQAFLPMQGVDAAEVAHGVDVALRHVSDEARADMAELAVALNSPLLGTVLDLRISPFVDLDVEDRRRALDAWRQSRLALRKSGYHALRRLCCASYYAQASTWPAMGYPGPPRYDMPPESP